MEPPPSVEPWYYSFSHINKPFYPLLSEFQVGPDSPQLGGLQNNMYSCQIPTSMHPKIFLIEKITHFLK